MAADRWVKSEEIGRAGLSRRVMTRILRDKHHVYKRLDLAEQEIGPHIIAYVYVHVCASYA